MVLNKRVGHNSRRRDKILYALGRRLDRKFFRAKADCFETSNVEKLLSGSPSFSVEPIGRRFTDSFSDEDIVRIRDTEPDIIIRFGFRILTGDILKVSKMGVWSLHHGDTSVNRGGPPGFWEVVNGDEVTGVTLQVLSDELDGGQVIDKAFSRTNRTSFNRNQNDLFWAGVELFCSAIDRQSRNPGFYLNNRWTQKFYSFTLYRDPSNLQSLNIFARFWLRRLREAVNSRSKRWRLYLKFGNGDPNTTLYKFRPLEQPADVDWADPFVITKEGNYYLFFEELRIGSRKANIAMLQFDKSGNSTSDKPLRVLEEEFHLSYPFVFEHDGVYYMTPECGGDNNVWLYRSDNFPNGWTKVRRLIDRELYDPTLFRHNGVWYLFATERPFEGNSPDQYLVIYYSEDLLKGDWTRHPMSPCVRDVRAARPAGRIIESNGLLFRPAQIGAPNYGYGIVFMQITVLTKTSYEEVYHDAILPTWHKGIRGVHTFNHVEGLTVVDAQVHI
ncbi:hypothetical protein WBG78_07235 [Chryseolinea sp. T2]|uniref:glucosamine inositolphosphorylceramide transferase family protein n=1 Tax=Chryseolinea sp. T2 TaxID=3129255 RepID=UPI0030773FC6